jgi:glycerate kinase
MSSPGAALIRSLRFLQISPDSLRSGERAVKILIAPDSFKESLSAMEVACEIEAGFREVFPEAEYRRVPVADGGEGTVEAMVAATGGRRVEVRVTGPLGEAVDAFYGLLGDGETAVIEMAAASGLELVAPEARNPLRTTSRGTGELIRHALDAGARRFVMGIGGSATNDGGAGMLQALGVRLMDAKGEEIGSGGGALAALARIDVSQLDARIAQSRIDVACDVDNPLTGPHGASATFGPQKGATPDMVRELDANLARFAQVLSRDLDATVSDVPGAGAAGGMGAAMLGVLGGRLRPGIEIVTETIGLDAMLDGVDLVVTGEGRIDGQTVHGKTPIGVARVAQARGIPVIGIAGSLADDAALVHAHGIDAVFAAVRRICTLDTALRDAGINVRAAARNAAATIRLGMQLRH